MPKMDDKKLAGIVETEFKNAQGAESHEISQERALAMRRFLREPLGNEEGAISEVVTSDVADVIDGLMPSFMRIFATAENLVHFDPVGEEDIAQAEQETDYVHYVFFKQNPWFLLIFYWIFDALLQKLGIVMAYWDTSKKVTYETYSGLTLLALQKLLDDEELEPLEQAEREDEDGETVYDIKFRRTEKYPGKVTVENVPPDEYRISSDARSLDPSSARMVGRERPMTRSAMKEMGFDPKWVDSLPAIKPQTSSSEKSARRNKSDEQQGSPQDKSQEEVLVRQAFIKVDYDGDGIAELRHVYTAGGQVGKWADGSVANDPEDRQPFHVLCPYPIPHKHFGQGVDDKVGENQDISTTITRQIIENLFRTNNPGHAVWTHGMNENTMDDLLTTAVGSVARFDRDPNVAHKSLTVPFTAQHSFTVLEYLDKIKRDRTGIDSDGEGLQAEDLKHIQRSVMASFTDLRKMKQELVARIFAETGFTSLFLHIHELTLKHHKRKDVFNLRGKFIPVDTSEWRHRRNMTVAVGLGLGTREQRLLHLESILEDQKEIYAGGGANLVVKPKHIYHTLTEKVKNAGFKDVGSFYDDPGEELAPPPSDEMQQLQRQQMELEQRRQQLDQMRHQIDQQKLMLERQEMALNHQREMADLQEKSEAREDKFTVENEKLRNDLAKMSAQIDKEREELQIKNAKLQAEIDNINADTMQKRAAAAKAMSEARARDVESDAAESGVSALLEHSGGD